MQSHFRKFFASLFSLLAILLVLADSAVAIDFDSSLKPVVGLVEGGSSTIDSSAASRKALLSISGINRAEMPGFFDPITNLPKDWKNYWDVTVKEENLPLMSLVASSTVLTVVTDYQTWKPFDKWYHSNNTVKVINDDMVFLGDGRFQLSLAGAIVGYGLISGDKKALRAASETIEVILASGIVVQVMKHLTGRQSPFVATTPTGIWMLFPNQIEYAKHTPHYDAFPSGHLTTLLGTVIVIANNYPNEKWIRPLGYTACLGMSLGLVASGIHWWSDFPLAIALGYGFGTLLSPTAEHADDIMTAQSKTDSLGHDHSELTRPGVLSKMASSAVFYPQVTPGGTGIGVAMRF